MDGREGIQLFGDAVSKKEKQDGYWKSKPFIFLAVLQIPLQYDRKLKC